MIQGLHIDITGAEVKARFQRRADMHTEKLAGYLRQRENLEANMDPRDKLSHGSMRSPLADLDEKIRAHRDGATYCAFMVEHVVTSETYRLSETELFRMGVEGARAY